MYLCILGLASLSIRDPVGWPVPQTAPLCGGRPFLGLSLVCGGWVMLAQSRTMGCVQHTSVHREGLHLSNAIATMPATPTDNPSLLSCAFPVLLRAGEQTAIHGSIQTGQAQQLKPVHDPILESSASLDEAITASASAFSIDTKRRTRNNGSPVSYPTARYECMWRELRT